MFAHLHEAAPKGVGGWADAAPPVQEQGMSREKMEGERDCSKHPRG